MFPSFCALGGGGDYAAKVPQAAVMLFAVLSYFVLMIGQCGSRVTDGAQQSHTDTEGMRGRGDRVRRLGA